MRGARERAGPADRPKKKKIRIRKRKKQYVNSREELGTEKLLKHSLFFLKSNRNVAERGEDAAPKPGADTGHTASERYAAAAVSPSVDWLLGRKQIINYFDSQNNSDGHSSDSGDWSLLALALSNVGISCLLSPWLIIASCNPDADDSTVWVGFTGFRL